MGFRKMQASVPKVTPMDILKGKYKEGINLPPQYMEMDPLETGGTFTNAGGKSSYGDIVPGKNIPMDADIFSKTVPGKVMPMDEFGNVFMTPPEIKSNPSLAHLR